MRLRTAVIVFAVGFVATLVLVLLLIPPDDESQTARLVVLALSTGLLAAAIANVVVMFRLLGPVKLTADPDKASQRAIARAVIANDDSTLDDAQRARAPRFAAAFVPFHEASAASQVLIIVALLGQQATAFMGGPDGLEVFRIVFTVLLLIAALIGWPIAVRQIRSVRRYSREHPIDATAGFEPAK